MPFNSLWSQPVQFSPSKDNWDVLDQQLRAKGEKGVYVIRDAADQRNLYIGKAEGTSQDIFNRVKTHLSSKGNKGIAKRVQEQETFTVRWIHSDRPELTESTLIIRLTPDDNRKVEWGNKFSQEETHKEAERIGLGKYSDDTLCKNLYAELFKRLSEERDQNWRTTKERKER